MASPPSTLPFYLIATSIPALDAVRKVHFFQFHVAVLLCPEELGLTACLTTLNSKLSHYFNKAGNFLLGVDPQLHISLNSLQGNYCTS